MGRTVTNPVTFSMKSSGSPQKDTKYKNKNVFFIADTDLFQTISDKHGSWNNDFIYGKTDTTFEYDEKTVQQIQEDVSKKLNGVNIFGIENSIPLYKPGDNLLQAKTSKGTAYTFNLSANDTIKLLFNGSKVSSTYYIDVAQNTSENLKNPVVKQDCLVYNGSDEPEGDTARVNNVNMLIRHFDRSFINETQSTGQTIKVPNPNGYRYLNYEMMGYAPKDTVYADTTLTTYPYDGAFSTYTTNNLLWSPFNTELSYNMDPDMYSPYSFDDKYIWFKTTLTFYLYKDSIINGSRLDLDTLAGYYYGNPDKTKDPTGSSPIIDKWPFMQLNLTLWFGFCGKDLTGSNDVKYKAGDLGVIKWGMSYSLAKILEGCDWFKTVDALKDKCAGYDWYKNNDVGVVVNNKPLEDGGTSRPGGGGGTFTGGGTAIGVSSLPVLSATDTGFVTTYCPSASAMKSLSAWMLSDEALTNLSKRFKNPLEAVIGLSIAPVAPPLGASTTVKFAGIDSGILMPPVTSQYVQKSCGTVSIPEVWGAFLDYAPYTKLSLYIPYCGVYSIDPDDVMGSTCTLVYNIDVLSGSCVAELVCGKVNGGSVSYTFSGNVNMNIPITSADWSNLARAMIGAAGNVLSVAGSIAATAATGGAAAPLAIGAVSSAVSTATDLFGASKPNVSRGGSIGSAIGALGVQVPYFIISRPVQGIPENFGALKGYTSNIYSNLGQLSGYTECNKVFTNGLFTATDSEKAEIVNLLQSGVIL